MPTHTDRQANDPGHIADSNRLLQHDSFSAWVSTSQELIDAVEDGERDIILAAGTYTLPEGVSLQVSTNQRIRGAGRERSIIVSENAYAFTAASTGNCDRVYLGDLSCQLAVGSTEGGAVRALSNGYHADWVLERVYTHGVTTSPDPLFNLHGMIGSYLRQCQAQGGQIGFRIGALGFPSNAMQISQCRASMCSVAGVELIGGGLQRLTDSIIENNGCGVSIQGVAAAQVVGNWFENMGGADVRVTGTATETTIAYNKFHYHHQDSTSPHIELIGPDYPASLIGVNLHHNYGGDPSGAGVGIAIDANCSGTKLEGNGFADPVLIEDHGTGTVMLQQPSGYETIPNVFTQPIRSGTRAYYGTPLPALWLQQLAAQTAPMLLAETLDNDLLFALSKNGYAVIGVNTAPTADDLGAGQVALWFDATPGACKLKFRGRNSSGATVNGEVALT